MRLARRQVPPPWPGRASAVPRGGVVGVAVAEPQGPRSSQTPVFPGVPPGPASTTWRARDGRCGRPSSPGVHGARVVRGAEQERARSSRVKTHSKIPFLQRRYVTGECWGCQRSSREALFLAMRKALACGRFAYVPQIVPYPQVLARMTALGTHPCLLQRRAAFALRAMRPFRSSGGSAPTMPRSASTCRQRWFESIRRTVRPSRQSWSTRSNDISRADSGSSRKATLSSELTHGHGGWLLKRC